LPFYPAYAYLGYAPKDFPAAYFKQSRILSLPIYPEMPEEAITRVADTISHFWSLECPKVIELTAKNLIDIEHRTSVLSDNKTTTVNGYRCCRQVDQLPMPTATG
jgi:hypothetical protein